MDNKLIPYLSMLLAPNTMSTSRRREEIPVGVNHPIIYKALMTLKYRIKNRVKTWGKFNKRLPDNKELTEIIHKTITSVGHELPSEEFCKLFYNIVKQSMEEKQNEQIQ